MKRIPTLIFGTVRTNGEKFYLLDDEPIKLKKVGAWQPEGTVCWKVANSGEYTLQNRSPDLLSEGKFVPVYNASLLVFGKDACVELLDDPQTVILVNYFTSEDEDVVVNPV